MEMVLLVAEANVLDIEYEGNENTSRVRRPTFNAMATDRYRYHTSPARSLDRWDCD